MPPNCNFLQAEAAAQAAAKVDSSKPVANIQVVNSNLPQKNNSCIVGCK